MRVLHRGADDPEQLEEERRLCYVGITRARNRIYLVRAFRRSLMGSSTVNKPSRFLQDIPSHLITGNGLQESKDIAAEEAFSAPEGIRAARYRVPVTQEQVKEPDIELPELKAGDHVTHGQFGEGVVVSVKSVNNDAEIVVAFTGVGIKRLLLSFAKLEKV